MSRASIEKYVGLAEVITLRVIVFVHVIVTLVKHL